VTGSVTALPGRDETHAVPFRDFDIGEAICSGLEAAGIFTTFPIQALTLPLALAGQDIIGQARTGTGKTLAFGVPLLQLIEEHGQSRLPQALVVVPTRELAVQVADDLRTAAVNLRVRVLTVYGGRAYEPQIDALTAGVDIVVGTPGRLLDLAERRHLDLSAVRALVLDEADKMLDLGFLPDVERIIRLIPEQRQTMLFSATMPGDVVTLKAQPIIAAQALREAGFKVDVQASDWQTVVSRRASQKPPKEGGWNMFFTNITAADGVNPVALLQINGRGRNGGWFGWPRVTIGCCLAASASACVM